tara:strand:+ start:81 stop:1016 length:936 start_codon:yes stop_codon:yes gene_type:complete
MSNQLIGDFKKRKGASIVGSVGQMVMVSVDVRSKVNRKTDASRISRYTKKGFDWNKWSLPTVAKLMDSDERYLLDGDHRRHMFKQFHPEATEMPAWEIEVESAEHFHKLFVEINSTCRKNVNGDEAFIHMVHAGDAAAIALRDQLINCGISVNGSPEAGGVQGAPNARFVKINSFKRALKVSDEKSVERAVKIIDGAWDAERYPSWGDKIHGELLQGFAVLYRNYKRLSDDSDFQKDFETWVETILSSNPPNEVASEYKRKGGAPQHRQGYAIAYAIITEFRKCNMHNALCSTKKKQDNLRLKNIRRYLTC